MTVSMPTSSAEPGRLETYGSAVRPVADAITVCAGKLEGALAAFLAGAGSFGPGITAAEWVAPVRGLDGEWGTSARDHPAPVVPSCGQRSRRGRGVRCDDG